MRKLFVRAFVCCVLLLPLQSYLLSPAAFGAEKAERIQALQERMIQLKSMLAELEEQQLREQPPEVIPWQPLISSGEERRAYARYAYFLAPQMGQETLGATLEQLYFTATRDALTQRGTLFVVPSINQTEVNPLAVSDYNRSLAADMLATLGIPSALAGGLLVTTDSIEKKTLQDQTVLYLDLDGCEPVLRARIFELLLTHDFQGTGGEFYPFIGALVAAAQPQTFKIYQQQHVIWLSVAAE